MKIHNENSITTKAKKLNKKINYNLILLGLFMFALGYFGYIQISLLTFGFYLAKRA